MKGRLPEGWSQSTLAELFDFKYGKGLPKDKRIGNGKFKVFGSNGVVGFHNSAITMGPAIIIRTKGFGGGDSSFSR